MHHVGGHSSLHVTTRISSSPAYRYMASLIRIRQLVHINVPCQGRIAQLRRAHAESQLVHALVYHVPAREDDLAMRVPVAARLVDVMMVAGVDGS